MKMFKELEDSIDKRCEERFECVFEKTLTDIVSRSDANKIKNIIKEIVREAISKDEIRKIHGEILEGRLQEAIIKNNFPPELSEKEYFLCLKHLIFNIIRKSIEENMDEVNKIYSWPAVNE